MLRIVISNLRAILSGCGLICGNGSEFGCPWDDEAKPGTTTGSGGCGDFGLPVFVSAVPVWPVKAEANINSLKANLFM